MKKLSNRKKLTLNKETLRELTAQEKREILGGAKTLPNSGSGNWTDTCTESRFFSCPC